MDIGFWRVTFPACNSPMKGFRRPGDKVWTPSDWAWAGGLLNALLPSLLLGVPVVSSPAQKFDADTAYRIMAEMKVRNAFIPPTALRLLKSVERPTHEIRSRSAHHRLRR